MLNDAEADSLALSDAEALALVETDWLKLTDAEALVLNETD